MKRTLHVFFSAVMVLALCACMSKPQPSAPDISTEPETTAEVTVENPVKKFAGSYENGKCTIDVTPLKNGQAKFLVHWGISGTEHTDWTMSGTFDPDTLTAEYSNCVKTEVSIGSENYPESGDQIYSGGKGKFVFAEGNPNTLTWVDDMEHAADGMIFNYAYGAE